MLTDKTYLNQVLERLSGDNKTFSDNLSTNKMLFEEMSERLSGDNKTFSDNLSTNKMLFEEMSEQFNSDRTLADENRTPTEVPSETEVNTVVEDNTQIPQVAPADNQMSTKLQDIQRDLTKLTNPAIMNNSQDLSALIDAKRSTIETVKVLQDIVKRYNINEKSKINTRMMNSR